MALPHPFPSLTDTLAYFDKYDYPLTKEELEYWVSPVSPSSIPPLTSQDAKRSFGLRGGKKRGVIFKNGFYFLSNRQNLVALRKQREKFSKAKWIIAKQVGERLQKFPFVAAIFVTGALAMDNCPKDDDIDLMIITYPNTLWITRFFIDLYLKLLKLRRLPNTEYRIMNTSNLICDNLWLDIKNLKFKIKNLYIAHEILQAKCIFDRGGIHYQFIKQNSWVKKYLPVAYKSQAQNSKIQINSKSQFPNTNLVIRILNLVLFVAQWLYMLPKMTTERVGLGFAFFHPSANIRK